MDSIDAALADLKLQSSPNYTATAKKFGVDRTTLSCRHKGVTAPPGFNPRAKALLSKQQTKGLVDYINKLTDRGLPPTAAMIRQFARDICGKEPGKNWAYRFVRSSENDLESGFLKGFDLSRKKADNKYQYKLYFDLVRSPNKSYFYTNIT